MAKTMVRKVNQSGSNVGSFVRSGVSACRQINTVYRTATILAKVANVLHAGLVT